MSSTQNKSLAVVEMGNRLCTIDIGRKVGGKLRRHLTQCGLSRALPLYQVAS